MTHETMKTYLQKFRNIARFCGQKLNWAYTAVLLSLVYFIVIGFMSLIVRLLRKDLLLKKDYSEQPTYWQKRISSEQTIDRQKFQF
ncbi:MAG: hypothetical protein ABSD46_06005 [Bacteroidota bacterium]